MIEISVNGLVKEYEVGSRILDGLTFQVDTGERVGLLGKNGSGKTTVFRILTGEVDWDEGEVMIAPGKRLGLISQIPVYPAGHTVEDVLDTAFERLKAMERELGELAKACNMEPLCMVTQQLPRVDQALYVRSGKADEIAELDERVDTVHAYCEELDEDLGAVEEILLEDDDEDDFECDGDCCNCDEECELADEDYFEIECPSCGDIVCFDGSIDPEELTCPACGEKFECLVSEEDLKALDAE